MVYRYIQYTLLVGTLFQEYFNLASNLVKVGINTIQLNGLVEKGN